VRRVQRRHAEAQVIAVVEPGPARVRPRCRHVAEGCGGCVWQHVGYAAQLAAKSDAVRDSLERLGGFRDLPIQPILPAPAEFHYRNKMEFAFHPVGTIGLHPRGAWYDILRLEECHLVAPVAMDLVKAARGFVETHGLSLYHPRTRQGLLRELCVRASRSTGEILLGLVTGPGAFPEAQAMAEHLAAVHACVAGVVRTMRDSPQGPAPLLDTTPLYGRDYITETAAGLRFRIHVDTFFQTNSAQAEQLMEIVGKLAGDVADADVVDVYCGVGLFSLALAARGARVTGVELVEAAVTAARQNADDNGLPPLSFHAGDARKVLAEILPAGRAPRVLVLDPPRAGAGGKVMRRIARAQPERVLYVSCNPTTLARDLTELRPFGYRIASVQPIDLFPQTYHVETVVLLERGPAGAQVPTLADADD
jgi:23S rRNA (uracil1939-C5)-methyltransferase